MFDVQAYENAALCAVERLAHHIYFVGEHKAVGRPDTLGYRRFFVVDSVHIFGIRNAAPATVAPRVADEFAADEVGVAPVADIVVVVAVGGRVQAQHAAAVVYEVHEVLDVLSGFFDGSLRLFGLHLGHLEICRTEARGGRVVEDDGVVLFEVFGSELINVVGNNCLPDSELFAHILEDLLGCNDAAVVAEAAGAREHENLARLFGSGGGFRGNAVVKSLDSARIEDRIGPIACYDLRAGRERGGKSDRCGAEQKSKFFHNVKSPLY